MALSVHASGAAFFAGTADGVTQAQPLLGRRESLVPVTWQHVEWKAQSDQHVGRHLQGVDGEPRVVDHFRTCATHTQQRNDVTEVGQVGLKVLLSPHS